MVQQYIHRTVLDMNWPELEREFSYTVHDDISDIQGTYNDVEGLERTSRKLGKERVVEQITKAVSDAGNRLLELHVSMRPFRNQEGTPSKAEMERFILDYLGKLSIAGDQIMKQMKSAEVLLPRIKNPELKDQAQKAIKRIKGMALVGHTRTVLIVGTMPKLKRHSLRKIVEEHIEQPVISREGERIEVVLQGKDEFALCDARLVKNALQNLLTDAINHTPGKQIFVRVGRKQGKPYLSVTSEGKPLTPKEKRRIGRVRFSRSKDPNRGWGKIGARINTIRQGGSFHVGNSKIGPKLELRFRPHRA